MFSEYRIMAITLVFQTRDVGPIPSIRNGLGAYQDKHFSDKEEIIGANPM